MALDTEVVLATLTQPDNVTPLQGTVTLVPAAGILVDSTDNRILAGAVTLELNAGAFTTRLPPTDAAGIQPAANTWNWHASFQLVGATIEPFSFALPTGSGPVDLADVIQVAALEGTYVVVPGPPGTNGTNGHTPFPYFGSVPPTTLHTDGDTYTQSNGDYYLQVSGAWVLAANLKGPKGDKGDAGAGGGGSSTRTSDVRITKENINLGSFPAWTILKTTGDSTPLQNSITAAVGDRIWADMVMMKTGSGNFLDLAVVLGSTILEYAGSGSSSPLPEGDVFLYPGNSFPGTVGTIQFVVKEGQVDGTGKVTVALVVQGSGDGGEVVYASAAYPWRLRLTNIGPEPA